MFSGCESVELQEGTECDTALVRMREVEGFVVLTK